MKTVEILSIGDELLRGIVAESNSHWLAKQIAARGAELRRSTVLPDEPPVVADALREALARAPALIVSHGGLGPTDDDRTREALALGLGREIALDPAAEEIVRRRYRELTDAGVVGEVADEAARMRMAHIPSGAQPLDNQIGAAPSLVLREGPTTIVALPGVPPELTWTWENPLSPILDEILGPGGAADVTVPTDTHDESAIAHVLPLVAAQHPGVYVKSRAHGFAADDIIRISLAASGPSIADARDLLAAALRDLRAALAAEGVRLGEEP